MKFKYEHRRGFKFGTYATWVGNAPGDTTFLAFFHASKPPPITVTFGCPDSLITRATCSAALPPSPS